MIDNTTAQYTSILTSTNAGMSPLFLAIGASSLASLFNGGNQNTGFIYSGVFGAWPATRDGSDIPSMAALVASVP
jgi:hypothetical protein